MGAHLFAHGLIRERAAPGRDVLRQVVGVRRGGQDAGDGRVDVALSRQELARLDAAGAIELGFPDDFPGRAMAYGNTYARIDGHRPQVWTDGLELSVPRQSAGTSAAAASSREP